MCQGGNFLLFSLRRYRSDAGLEVGGTVEAGETVQQGRHLPSVSLLPAIPYGPPQRLPGLIPECRAKHNSLLGAAPNQPD